MYVQNLFLSFMLPNRLKYDPTASILTSSHVVYA